MDFGLAIGKNNFQCILGVQSINIFLNTGLISTDENIGRHFHCSMKDINDYRKEWFYFGNYKQWKQ